MCVKLTLSIYDQMDSCKTCSAWKCMICLWCKMWYLDDKNDHVAFIDDFLKHWAIFLFNIWILLVWDSLWLVFKLYVLTLFTDGSTNLKTFLNKWILILVLHDKLHQIVRCYTHLNNLIILNFTKEIHW